MAFCKDLMLLAANRLKNPTFVETDRSSNWHQLLVLSRTNYQGTKQSRKKPNSDGIRSAAIHSNKSQVALKRFNSEGIKVFVSTDIAARGLVISQLPQAVKFELLTVSEEYVH
ncbi:MAG: helicase-related protein [Pseudomonadota bacterium]